jgi:hypothetical protein
MNQPLIKMLAVEIEQTDIKHVSISEKKPDHSSGLIIHLSAYKYRSSGFCADG